MNVLAELKERFRGALAGLAGERNATEGVPYRAEQVAELLDMIRPAQDAKFGDYQANFAMPLGKRLGRPPREVAAEIVKQVKLDDLCQPAEIAGPGFINLRLRDEWLGGGPQSAVGDERLGVAAAERPRTVVVDYSSPNVAKP